jgi:hypothetical protein
VCELAGAVKERVFGAMDQSAGGSGLVALRDFERFIRYQGI